MGHRSQHVLQQKAYPEHLHIALLKIYIIPKIKKNKTFVVDHIYYIQASDLPHHY